MISPTILRLTRPAILAWICRMLRLVDVASATISVTMCYSETVSNDDLRSGTSIQVTVYDRDARASDKQEIVQFTLAPEYRSSLIPEAPAGIVKDQRALYSGWAKGLYWSPILTARPDAVPDRLLAQLPNVTDRILKPLGEPNSFGDACLDLTGDYAQLAFNPSDQVALAWAMLKDSRVLRQIPLLASGVAAGDSADLVAKRRQLLSFAFARA